LPEPERPEYNETNVVGSIDSLLRDLLRTIEEALEDFIADEDQAQRDFEILEAKTLTKIKNLRADL
jgi:hypothetical protein